MYVTLSGFHVLSGVEDLCNFLTKQLDCSVVEIYHDFPLFSLKHSAFPVCCHNVLALYVYFELYFLVSTSCHFSCIFPLITQSITALHEAQ